MAKMTIDLQDGFRNDEVVVRIAGREVLHEHGVSEDPAISLAHSQEVEAPDGPAEVEVTLPQRELTKRLRVVPMEQPFLTARVTNGNLIAKASPDPPLYF
jgi:hypothetical protein